MSARARASVSQLDRRSLLRTTGDRGAHCRRCGAAAPRGGPAVRRGAAEGEAFDSEAAMHQHISM